jgi:hypothetical protein
LAVGLALALCGAVARAEPPVESRYQVNGSLSGGWVSISNPSGTSATQEAMSVELTLFRTLLQDDESPYSLQPFMQRESTLSLSTDIGRFEQALSGNVYRTWFYATAGAKADAYLKQWFAVFASASYAYSEVGGDVSQTAHVFSTGVGVGFRYRNTRLDLSVGEEVPRASGAFGPWRGNLTVTAFTVIKHRLSLDASGTLFDGAVQGFLEAGLFPSKGTGVFVSASTSRSDIDIRQYGGSVGLVCWFDARSGLLGEYALSYTTSSASTDVASGDHELAHSLLVEAYFRYR